jgi:hypothetical protein
MAKGNTHNKTPETVGWQPEEGWPITASDGDLNEFAENPCPTGFSALWAGGREVRCRLRRDGTS